MAWWGPLIGVSEFPGERLCGFLQKINTNGKVEEMGQTIMWRFCHQQCLLCKAPPKEHNPKTIIQKNVGRLFEMDDKSYNQLLAYHQAQDSSWKDYRKIPHIDGSCILASYAHEVVGLTSQSGMWYSKKGTSNMVKVEHFGKLSRGMVVHIFELMESKEQVVMVKWLERISDPILDPILDRLGLVRVVHSFKTEFIPAASVVSTLSHRELPAWTLGSQSPSLLLVDFNPGDHEFNFTGAEDMDDVYMGPPEDQMDID
ncbi:hypothetical protein DFH28DRAFT_905323 [Melampsora americana]|nr:hypothetical protein DFH28DRAFT_905323 [Melampsora americana]